MRGTCALRVAVWIDDVRSHVSFEDLGREASDGAAAGGEQVHHFPAIALLDERAFDRFDLTANAANAVQEFLFVSRRVRHDVIGYSLWYLRGQASSS